MDCAFRLLLKLEDACHEHVLLGHGFARNRRFKLLIARRWLPQALHILVGYTHLVARGVLMVLSVGFVRVVPVLLGALWQVLARSLAARSRQLLLRQQTVSSVVHHYLTILSN